MCTYIYIYIYFIREIKTKMCHTKEKNYSVLAADKDPRGRNVLFISSLLRPYLKIFVDFQLLLSSYIDI